MALAKASDIYLAHLRAWRADKGLTQNELAERAGVARGTIIRAENGGGVNALSAARIAKALDVSVSRLQSETPM